MQVSRKKLDENRVRLTVSLNADEVDNTIRHGCTVMAYQSQILPDPNRSPYDMCVEKLGKEEVDKILETFVMDYYAAGAIGDRKLKTIGAPTYHSEMVLERGKPYTFQMMVVLCPVVSLDDYSPVEITVEEISITEEEYEEYKAKRLDEMKEYLPVDDPDHDVVRKGDTVNIKMDTNQNGEEVKGLCSDSRPYQTGEGLMPDGFDEGVIGMKLGETKTWVFDGPSLDFDDDGNPIMEPYETTVTVLSFSEERVPDLTDEWVTKHYPGLSTVEEFEKRIYDDLKKAKERQDRHYRNYLAASALARRFNGTIPDDVYEAVKREQDFGFKTELDRQGLTKEEFFQQQGIDEQQFNMMQMMQMREQLVQQICIDAVARHENIKVTEADIQEFFHEYAPGRESQTRKSFEESGRMYIAEESALRLKANDWLTAHATINVVKKDDTPLTPTTSIPSAEVVDETE